MSKEEATIKAPEISAERRKGIRYRMRVQVIFRWSKSRKDRFQGEGTTRDVSLAGAYVLSDTCPPVNTTVQVEIILPPLSPESSTRMKAEMKVLRVDGELSRERPGGFSLAGKGFSVRAVPTRQTDPVKDLIPELEGKL